MNFETFLSHFPAKPRDKIKGGLNVLCPSHNDIKPSLSVVQSKDRILLHCQAGCSTQSILKGLELQMSDLFINEKQSTSPKIAATYSYKNEVGEELFQVVRYKPKNFKQRHKNSNGEWVWNMNGVRRVLYHLNAIVRVTSDTIYFCEGETDVDNLWARGLVATTSPGGANNWKAEYAEPLKNKRVVIIPDKDKAGYEYARSVAHSLPSNTKCIILDKGKDISDWLELGGDISHLPSLEQDISALFNLDKPAYKMEDEAIVWHKTIDDESITFKAISLKQERTGIHGKVSIFCDYMPLAWSILNIERSEDRIRLSNAAYGQLRKGTAYTKEEMRRDLDNFCLGLWEFNISTSMPELVAGNELQEPLNFILKPFILDGGGTILFSPAGRGKSYTALFWAVCVDAGIAKFGTVTESPSLFINLERSSNTIRHRLASVNKILGLPPERRLLILNARGKSLQDILPICQKAIAEHNIKFVVLDSISRAGYGDLTENRPVNSIIDALSSLCETWLALAHSPRGDETHIYGGVHFDAGADIVVRLVSEIKDGILGIGYEIIKANDLPKTPQIIWAFEFNEIGLTNIRKALPNEFIEVQGKSYQPMEDIIVEWLLDKDSGDATATETAEALGFNRVNVSRHFNTSGKFVKTRKVGVKQYYGVKV